MSRLSQCWPGNDADLKVGTTDVITTNVITTNVITTNVIMTNVIRRMSSDECHHVADSLSAGLQAGPIPVAQRFSAVLLERHSRQLFAFSQQSIDG
jgi:hypothetical protein